MTQFKTMEDFAHLDYYEILGVTQESTAEEVKRAYHQQIARYHPDRYAQASNAEKQYAVERTQYINEAYRVLSQFGARNAYHRMSDKRASSHSFKTATSRSTHSTRMHHRDTAHPETGPARDYQEELYQRASEHLEAGRYVQAIALFRELQNINPFYRDSAKLLARAEAANQKEAAAASKTNIPNIFSLLRQSKRILAFIGGIGAIIIVGIVVIVLILPQFTVKSARSTAIVPEPTATDDALMPSPTITPPLPTTAPPTVTPNKNLLLASPTVEVESASAPSPTTMSHPAHSSAQTVAESGTIIQTFSFNSDEGWAQDKGNSWSVGLSDNAYRITTNSDAGNIWSYRTAPTNSDMSIGADVQINDGAAGLVMHFEDTKNYLAFFIDPQTASYWLEQRIQRQPTTIAEGNSQFIETSTDATNRLVAQLKGTTIQLFINNMLVVDETLEDIEPTNTYGLVAVATSTSANALFDNVEVRTLQ